MSNVFAGLAAAVILLFVGAAISLLIAFPVMLLWNVVVPDVFGLPSLSFWQALALSALCSLLFKSSQSSNSKS